MCGWLSAAMARASRSKRSRSDGSPAQARGQDLDRDRAVEPRVARAIDLAHAAGADATGDFIGAEARAGDERHFGSFAFSSSNQLRTTRISRGEP